MKSVNTKTYKSKIYCSECGEKISIEFKSTATNEIKFCNNCGAENQYVIVQADLTPIIMQVVYK